jgi:hypothetical protein
LELGVGWGAPVASGAAGASRAAAFFAVSAPAAAGRSEFIIGEYAVAILVHPGKPILHAGQVEIGEFLFRNQAIAILIQFTEIGRAAAFSPASAAFRAIFTIFARGLNFGLCDGPVLVAVQALEHVCIALLGRRAEFLFSELAVSVCIRFFHHPLAPTASFAILSGSGHSRSGQAHAGRYSGNSRDLPECIHEKPPFQ